MKTHPLRLAHLLHRLSGLALALFLPLHFWVLAMAVNQAERLDRLLTLTELPLVKFAEFGLVFLLAVHIAGGLRLMALEHLGWTARQKSLAAGAVGLALLLSGTFFLSAL